MGPKQFASRFLAIPIFVTIYYLWKYGARVSPRAEVELSRNLKLGKRANISSFVKIKASAGPLTIGNDVSVTSGCTITSGAAGLEIGDDSLIGPNVTIVANTYRFDRIDIPMREQGSTSTGTRLGRNVFVGAGACILDGADIGDGAIIAPNSVVSTKIPPNAIVQGAPGKVIFIRR